MKLELDQSDTGLRISAYTEASVCIADRVYSDSIIINTERVIEDVLPATVLELQPRHLHTIIDMQPEIVLFGTGPRLCHPPDNIAQTLFQHHIGMEIMDTGAACRSFNFLLGEGRRIVCLLFIGAGAN
ncbi:MAG: Mth938-like domain-containing protein [Gammaproteobacteria bacterium]